MALRDYGLAELAVAIHGLSMRGGRVHAGIHQARKAIRRTRAMLTLGEPRWVQARASSTAGCAR